MAKAIGPTFGQELAAAGLAGLPFSWGTDGVIQFDPRMTPTQIAAVQAVYAAHNPTKILPDAVGFETAVVAALGGPAALNTLLASHPLVWWALRDRNWLVLQQFIIAANTAGKLTPGQYAAIKAAVAQFAIPMTLP